MKKRIMSMLIAICLIAGLLPAVGLTVSAAAESAKVTLNTKYAQVTLEVEGSEVAYAVTDTAGTPTKVDSEPTDKYVKLAIVDGVATLYLKKATLIGKDNVIDLTAISDRVNIVVLADSAVTTNSDGIVHKKQDLSISGPGKLTVQTLSLDTSSAIAVTAGGNLIFEESANVNVSSTFGRCIYVESGNLITKGNVNITGNGATLVDVLNDMTVEQGSFAVTPTAQGTYVKVGNLTVNGGTMSVLKGAGLGDSMTWAIEAGNVTLNGGTLQTNIGRALDCRGKVTFNGGKHDLKTNFNNKLVNLITAQSITFNGGEVELYAHGQSYLSNVEMKVGATGKYVATAGASKITAQSIGGNTYPMNNMLCYGYFGLPINEFTTLPAIESWSTDDPAPKPVGEALYGKVEFLYATAEDGEYTATQPTTPGTYYMKATVAKGNQNCGGYVLSYEAIESKPVSFVIEQAVEPTVPETQPSQPETQPTEADPQPSTPATEPAGSNGGSGADVLTWVVICVSVVAVAVAGFAVWMVLSSRKKS